LLQATPENFKVCILRLTELGHNSENFVFNNCVKAFFMFADVRLVNSDPNPELADGEIPIFDMKGLSFWHLLKTTLSTLKLYFKYVQEAHPVRIQQIHVCNCTPLINRIMSLVKPLMKPEVAARLQFHTADNPETLYQFVPKDILPEDYDGSGPKMSVLKEHWMKKFYEHRCMHRRKSNSRN